MYKKRLKAWGLSKHVKSDKKENALAQLLHSAPTTTGSNPIRHDKLVRYAKSRAKSGALDSHYLSRVLKRDRFYEHKRPILRPSPIKQNTVTNVRHSATKSSFLPRSPALPDGLADFNLFLRAMQALIEREREEWLTGEQTSPDAIFDALTRGMSYWRSNAFAAARRSFGQAAHKMTEDVQGNVVLVSRITYCISSIIWGSGREPVFQKFAQFMANAALEVLGQDCPLTIVLQHLQREQSMDAQLAIWACALDGYQVSEQNFNHWWDMAQRRWRWCRRSGMNDRAARYCNHAMIEVRRINKLTNDMELEARQDLESTVPGAGISQIPKEDGFRQ